MTLKDLNNRQEINNRTFDVCIFNNLKTLNELINYYEKNISFDKLRYCDNESKKELFNIYQNYTKKSFNEHFDDSNVKESLNISIKELLSVRSYHVCKYNNLNSLKDLKEYYFINKSFNKLRNCGRKSDEELIEICNKYQLNHFDNQETEIKLKNPLKIIILELTRVQREVINSFILVNTNYLSVRSKNAIIIHLRKNLKIKNFAERILLSDNFNVKNIKNVGGKCVLELEIYISNIKDFLYEISQSNNEKKLISLKNNFLIQRTFSISKIPSKILETESIFLLTDFLLNQNALFDETQTVIVKKAFKIYQNQKELTLDDIADEIKLTRERVRQIRVMCLDELFGKLSFIQNFNDDLFQKYNIDINSDQIELNSDIVNVINNTNGKYFSREFITYILFVYLNDSHSLLGNIEDVLVPKFINTRKRYSWENFYLIKKGIETEIDFNSLTFDIENRLSDRIKETYSFNFKSYLSRFLFNNNIEILDLAFPICENIINEEFELYLDLESNIIFNRNTKKQVHEYSYEALEQLGKPSKVKEIFEKIIDINPNYNTEEAKIRSSMKRIHGFLPVGRKSVFGLKKWENELENFKGGTIRDIVEEYLSQLSKPQHISGITKHILKYRPKSNANSIFQNLKLDESGLYIFYKDSYIGLSNKTYEDDFIKLTEVKKAKPKSWNDNLELLKEFINKENRLPYSKGCNESEKKLYRWFNVQKNKSFNGKIESKKENIITEIENKYYQVNGKQKTNTIAFYFVLLAFVKKNFRLPISNRKGEESLYRFFYKQRKLFDKEELEEKEETLFIEVAKLLQNINHEN